MKQTLSMVMAAMTIAALTSCSNDNGTSFTGKITGLQDNFILLGGILTPQIDTIQVNEDGTFDARIELTEPKTDYVIMEHPKSGFKVYLEPGSKLDCQVETYDTVVNNFPITRSRVKFVGDNADCNDFLNNDQLNYYTLQGEMINEVIAKKLPFLQFKQQLGEKVEEVKKEIEKLSNPRFVEANKADYDKKFETALEFYGDFMPQQDEDYKAYLKSADLNDLANINKAGMYANYYQKFEAPATEGDIFVAYFRMLPQLFTNQEVVSALADQKIQGIIQQAPGNLDEIYSVYKEIKKTDSIPANIQKEFNRFNVMSAGKKAVDFDMYDTCGRKVMLSDLKGKAVYMDCWATWCGPCKAEIPYMEKLYEHYKNNPNLILVSVSLDKTTKPWLEMLEKDKPQWPQYIVKDEFKSKLCTTYSITGSPRFMMFDKDGNVISLNAPRPSSEDIIRFIDDALKR